MYLLFILRCNHCERGIVSYTLSWTFFNLGLRDAGICKYDSWRYGWEWCPTLLLHLGNSVSEYVSSKSFLWQMHNGLLREWVDFSLFICCLFKKHKNFIGQTEWFILSGISKQTISREACVYCYGATTQTAAYCPHRQYQMKSVVKEDRVILAKFVSFSI